VLGRATGHHCVHRDLLDRDLHQVGRNDGDDLVAPSAGPFQHPQHSGFRRRDEREPVGPATIEQRLDLVLELGQRDAAGPELGAGETDAQLVGQVRVRGQ
jgi:hypothetical protein